MAGGIEAQPRGADCVGLVHDLRPADVETGGGPGKGEGQQQPEQPERHRLDGSEAGGLERRIASKGPAPDAAARLEAAEQREEESTEKHEGQGSVRHGQSILRLRRPDASQRALPSSAAARASRLKGP